jgi:TPR repeat protein
MASTRKIISKTADCFSVLLPKFLLEYPFTYRGTSLVASAGAHKNDYEKTGNVSALYSLAVVMLMPEFPGPRKQNRAESIQFLIQCAKNNHAGAMKKLGDIYSDIDADEYDSEKARRWYLRAADAGCVESAKLASAIRGGPEIENTIGKLINEQQQNKEELVK